MIYIDIILSAISIVLLIPAAVLFLQVVFSFLKPESVIESARNEVVGVLIPAHNESSVLAHTLSELKPQIKSGDRILVVADNCSDDTAEVARSYGVEVIERHDEVLIGKAYALEFGVEYFKANPPEVIIVMDADCTISQNGIGLLASMALKKSRVVQGSYLMKNSRNASLKMIISEFAFLVKCHVRQLGSHKMGWPSSLMGTGMAFPWAHLQSCDLNNGNIVEDVKLGLDLTEAGLPPVFCKDVTITSYFPDKEAGYASQRSRWEHGHLHMLLIDVPKILYRSLKQRNFSLFAMALSIMVPPLALFVLVASLMFVLGFIYSLITSVLVPLAIITVAVSLVGAAVLFAWWGYGRNILSLTELFYIPVYVFKKVPLYMAFLVNRQIKWVKTER